MVPSPEKGIPAYHIVTVSIRISTEIQLFGRLCTVELPCDFGVLDSAEKIAYEDWHGHKLDRKMLQMLQQY